jgi:hypothetical protein
MLFDKKIIESETYRAFPPAVNGQGGDTASSPDVKSAIVYGGAARMWQNPRVAKLMNVLLNGNIASITPEIDLRHKDGYMYRDADDILGTSGKETSIILDYAAREGLILKQDFQKLLVSPGGSVQLMPVERCPSCDSEQIIRGQLIEHFHCGHIGLEEEFNSGLKQVCPKCHRELKLIGTDYRKPGARYVCNSCHGVFAAPTIKCRDLKTGEVYSLEELRYVNLYSYRLNEAKRKRLEFEFEPKKQLIDCLKRRGYHVQESVKVRGRSGATHTIDLLASIDDPITRHSVAIGILAASNDEIEVDIDTLFSFDSKIYDAGIDSKMVIAVPRLNAEAAKFAQRQGIRVYSLDELRYLSSRQTALAEASDARQKPMAESDNEPDPDRLDPKGWLRWFLEKKGYRVEEKYKLKGRSGAEHILDFYAQKDDGIVNHSLAACIIADEVSQANHTNIVTNFDSATYDVGIRDKVIISVPKLGKEDRQFADYQRIKILEAEDLADFSKQYLKNGIRADIKR